MAANKPATNWEDGDDVQEAAAPAPASTPADSKIAGAKDESHIEDEVEKSKKAAAPAPAEEPDNFPSDYKAALKLRGELSRFAHIGDKPTPEQTKGHAKYARLSAHIHKLQQGLPHIHVDATSKGAFAGLHVSDRTKWEYLARTSPDVKKLLAAHDALVAELTKLKTPKK